MFWVPKEARCGHLQAQAKQPSIGRDVDDAMVALERDNPRLKEALNKNYGRADLDKHRLGEPIDLIGSIQLADVASRSKDLLGRVFEYFLGRIKKQLSGTLERPEWVWKSWHADGTTTKMHGIDARAGQFKPLLQG